MDEKTENTIFAVGMLLVLCMVVYGVWLGCTHLLKKEQPITQSNESLAKIPNACDNLTIEDYCTNGTLVAFYYNGVPVDSHFEFSGFGGTPCLADAREYNHVDDWDYLMSCWNVRQAKQAEIDAIIEQERQEEIRNRVCKTLVLNETECEGVVI